MTKWFTADQHFYHRKIIEYCNRPFKSEKHMRNTLINNFNDVVRKDDQTFILGDAAMLGGSQWERLRGVIQKLNGTKHLIYGNHDELRWQRYIDVGFTTTHSALWLDEGGHHIVMAHDPSVYCTLAPGTIFLHGHIHTLYKSIPDKRVVNVGVDMWNYCPVNLEQIFKELGL